MKIALMTDTAKLPTRKHAIDAGLDLYLDNPISSIEVYPGEVETVHTGVTIEVPQGAFGWITNKSSKNYLIGGGIVDEGYQGELLVKIVNPTTKTLIFNHGDAIAQLLIIPVYIPMLEILPRDEIHKKVSQRGMSGGIGGGVAERIALEKMSLEDDYDYFMDDLNFDADRERKL